MQPRHTTGIMFSYINKSAYHENCLPRHNTATQVTLNCLRPSETQLKTSDVVTQDKIWRQNVDSERRCLQNWGENWGFLTEYDYKGVPREKRVLPQKVTLYSRDIPNTNSGNYGRRLETEVGRTMQKMELQFYSDRRRRKLDSQMLCY